MEIIPSDSENRQLVQLQEAMKQIRLNNLLALHSMDLFAKDIASFLAMEQRPPAIQAMLEKQAEIMQATYSEELTRWAAGQTTDMLEQAKRAPVEVGDLVDVTPQRHRYRWTRTDQYLWGDRRYGCAADIIWTVLTLIGFGMAAVKVGDVDFLLPCGFFLGWLIGLWVISLILPHRLPFGL